MQPQISIIIPVYNVEEYLEECLDSIFRQTLSPSKLEIICVDDGSTDASGMILQRYAERYSNLRVVHQENAGSSVARNRGLDLACGEYIFFMDSDDTLGRSDALQLLYEQAAEFELDELCFCAEIRVEEEDLKRIFPRDAFHFHYSYPSNLVLSGQEMYKLQIENDDYKVHPWRRLYRRLFLLEHGLRFIEGILHQDQVFARQCTALASRVGCSDLICYNYRLRQNSITANVRVKPYKSIYSRLYGTNVLREFIKTHLTGADEEFLEVFTAHMKEWIDWNNIIYTKLSYRERREFWQSVPRDQQKELKKRMRAELRDTDVDINEIRLKKIKGKIRRLMPPKLWSLLKRVTHGSH